MDKVLSRPFLKLEIKKIHCRSTCCLSSCQTSASGFGLGKNAAWFRRLFMCCCTSASPPSSSSVENISEIEGKGGERELAASSAAAAATAVG